MNGVSGGHEISLLVFKEEVGKRLAAADQSSAAAKHGSWIITNMGQGHREEMRPSHRGEKMGTMEAAEDGSTALVAEIAAANSSPIRGTMFAPVELRCSAVTALFS